MAAHAKKTKRGKKERTALAKGKAKSRVSLQPAEPQPTAGAVDDSASFDEEPKPEDLAREEAEAKAAEAEEQARMAARDAAGSPRSRQDRSSYDGDTAIKLYLREIGQVKLLTPQEEIDLAARIKKGDKKARE